MASKKKEEKEVIIETEQVENTEKTTEQVKNTEKTVKQEAKKETKTEKKPKYKIGSIVYIEKEADADLNGFKLFPQYKKYAYTVEAYNQNTGVYTLRRLNLSLSIKEDLIVSPDERAHDQLNRMQF